MKPRILNWFKNISIKNKLYFIVGIMLFLIAFELAMLYSMVYLLSAARAYVGGESLWSKAEKDATIYLLKYANSRDEKDYLQFLSFINVTLGDKKARLALMKPHPDSNIAYQGFIEGRNQPADVPRLIMLFRWFQYESHLRSAASYWIEADGKYLPRLMEIGANLHQEIANNTLTPIERDKWINEIYDLNSHLTKIAENFSFALGDASRWLEHVVLKTVLIIAITVELSGLLLTLFVTFNIRKGINEIIRVSKQVRSVNFKERARLYSNDEIGQLANAFNRMIDDLEKSTRQRNIEIAERSKAEVASNVLHNVGNTLNSVNTSLSILSEKSSRFKIDTIVDLDKLITLHANDLPDFLSHDAKGKYVPEFLSLLAREWLNEKKVITDEINSLKKNVNHITNIIMIQQTMSNPNIMAEEVDMPEMIKEAILLNKLLCDRINVKISRDFYPVKPIVIDKNKLFQIIVNLVKNAMEALIENDQAEKLFLIVLKEKDDAHFMLQFMDNGIGVAPENIHKIFSYGFTTKKMGHGFGLNNSAFLAKELGGTLSFVSKGIGFGATFTLTLPYQPDMQQGG